MTEPLSISAHGSSYRIHDPGGIMGRALRAGRPYEAPLLEHVYERGFSGLAVDVGASIGNHSLWFAAVCGLDVVAVEPIDHERLLANVALNSSLPIRVHRIALSDSSCSAHEQMRPAPSHVVGDPAAVVNPKDLEKLIASSPTGRLDDMELRGVSVIKIDVEGMEPQVLRGAKKTIERERPVIYAEAEDEAAGRRNAAELSPLGYRHVKTFGATPLEEWEPE